MISRKHYLGIAGIALIATLLIVPMASATTPPDSTLTGLVNSIKSVVLNIQTKVGWTLGNLTAGITAINNSLTDVRNDVSSVNATVNNINATVNDLQTTLDEIETSVNGPNYVRILINMQIGNTPLVIQILPEVIGQTYSGQISLSYYGAGHSQVIAMLPGYGTSVLGDAYSGDDINTVFACDSLVLEIRNPGSEAQVIVSAVIQYTNCTNGAYYYLDHIP